MIATGRMWSLCFDGERPFTLNGERKMNPYERARHVAEWRARFQAIALVEKIPPLETVKITAWPLVANRRAMQDTAACVPCVKAAIDGLVDARVLVDDGPRIVRAVTFVGPVVGDLDGLTLIVEELG
jgi:hypothetical protein